MFPKIPNEIEYTLPFESLQDESESRSNSLIEKLPKLDLKPLPDHLKYAYLGEDETLPVIISTTLSLNQETSLLSILSKNREAIGWSITDIMGISPALVPRIHLVEKAKHVLMCNEALTQK